jgi:hypothetical protein
MIFGSDARRRRPPGRLSARSLAIVSLLVWMAALPAQRHVESGRATDFAQVSGTRSLAWTIIVALTSAFTVAFASRARRIAFRVAGSWAAAIALLMLGWTLRGAS